MRESRHISANMAAWQQTIQCQGPGRERDKPMTDAQLDAIIGFLTRNKKHIQGGKHDTRTTRQAVRTKAASTRETAARTVAGIPAQCWKVSILGH